MLSYLGVLKLLAALVGIHASLLKASSLSEIKPKPLICLVAPALPWTFGPYQRQMYLLSVGLHERGYEIYWMPMSPNQPLAPGIYSVEEVKQIHSVAKILDNTGSLDHLTIFSIGAEPPVVHGFNAFLSVTTFNRLAKEHNFHGIITLMDTTNMIRDDYFRVPAISWLPYHYSELQSNDVYRLNGFGAVASLAPTMAKNIERQLHAISRGIRPPTIVRYVPHILDEVSSLSVDSIRSSLGMGEDTFVVLMQGGNYDAEDRKGWFWGVQAYARFWHAHPEADIHMYIHALSSLRIAENVRRKTPPAHIKNRGVDVLSFIEQMKLPPWAFTLDENIYTAKRVAELKGMADVCLHPSKTEGFGLNSLECQALGVPVITTDFSAMADFTRHGIKVPFRQQQVMMGNLVAVPDVQGVAEALEAIWKGEAPTATAATAAATKAWLVEEFSTERVVGQFDSLLQELALTLPTEDPTYDQASLYRIVTALESPVVDWDTPWTLCAEPGIEFDHNAIVQLVSLITRAGAHEASVIVIPITRGGRAVDVKLANGQMNPDVPVMIRTQLFVSARNQVSKNRLPIVRTLMSVALGIKRLPDGLARFSKAGGRVKGKGRSAKKRAKKRKARAEL